VPFVTLSPSRLVSTLVESVNSLPRLVVEPESAGTIHNLRIYDRFLRTSEAVANFHAG
jgi:hypothetical protein